MPKTRRLSDTDYAMCEKIFYKYGPAALAIALLLVAALAGR
jgi:hypothetical protein